jgi:aryl carrier-like protein
VRIEARDSQILAEVFLSRVIRRDDLIAIGLFKSIGRCNSRLLALKKEGFLSSRTRLSGSELRAPLYQCTAKGVRIAAETLDFSPEEAIELHRCGIRDLAIHHTLRCTDLRLQFVKIASGMTLECWSQELLCHHEFQTCSGSLLTMKPDALSVLKLEGQRKHLFIEADLGNASLPKFKEKIGRYIKYSVSGAFESAYGSKGFHVLTVTTGDRRLQTLATLSNGHLFIFSTWERLNSGGINAEAFTLDGHKWQSLHSLLSEGDGN